MSSLPKIVERASDRRSGEHSEDWFRRLEQLNEIGAALSLEKNLNALLEKILMAAKTITRADGGTLYLVEGEGGAQQLRFEIVRTASLDIAMGGTTGNAIPFYPIHLFREGDPANCFYLIELGRVSLQSPRKDEEPVAVQIIGPGDVLGWSWLFPPYYWHFDARALEPTTSIFFYGTRLREHCERDHAFGYEIMKRVAQVIIHRLLAARRQLVAQPRVLPAR
jgi:hypothetical protein